jgi:hypothetical protein
MSILAMLVLILVLTMQTVNVLLLLPIAQVGRAAPSG